MKNNVSKEKTFRNRIADCTLERKVITQNEDVFKKCRYRN